MIQGFLKQFPEPWYRLISHIKEGDKSENCLPLHIQTTSSQVAIDIEILDFQIPTILYALRETFCALSG